MSVQNKVNEFRDGSTILFACFIGVGAGLASLSYYTSGIFMSAFEAEFGWSRGMISAQGLLGLGAMTLLAPVVGSIIDKVGTRVVASTSLFLYALSFVVISEFVDSLLLFYLLSLGAAIVAIGTTPITFTRAITGWFDEARGLALGIALVGTGVTGFIAPLLLTPYVTENGWREGLRALAAVVFVAAVIVTFLLRDNTEDSDNKSTSETTPHSARNEGSFSNTSSHVFPLMGLIFFLVAIAVSGMIVHFIPMLLDSGLPAITAGQYASIIGLSVIFGRLMTGYLIDNFFAPRVAAILFGLSALGYGIFAIGGADLALLAAIAVGLSMGAEVDLIAYLTSRYFGLHSYGRLYGILYAIFIFGAGLSPVIMGIMFDVFGSYDFAIVGSVICLALAASLTLLLPRFPVHHLYVSRQGL